MDVISINRYYAWYKDAGHIETIKTAFSYDLDQWYATHKKPMLITEYGAGAVAGIHEVSVPCPALRWFQQLLAYL